MNVKAVKEEGAAIEESRILGFSEGPRCPITFCAECWDGEAEPQTDERAFRREIPRRK